MDSTIQTAGQTAGPAAVDALAALHTRIVDAGAGFEKMVEKAEREFRPVAVAFRDLHRRHADSLAGLLVTHGRVPDTGGSFMATVNRAVIATRALFDEIDADVMAQIRSGEEHVLQAFSDAGDQAFPEDERAAIAAMHGELTALLARTADAEKPPVG